MAVLLRAGASHRNWAATGIRLALAKGREFREEISVGEAGKIIVLQPSRKN